MMYFGLFLFFSRRCCFWLHSSLSSAVFLVWRSLPRERKSAEKQLKYKGTPAGGKALTVGAFHPGLLPLAVRSAADHRGVALPEAGLALVADDGMNRVFLSSGPKHVGVLHLWWGTAGH